MTATVRTTGLDVDGGALAVVLAPEPDKRPRRRAGRHLRPVERPSKKRSPAVPAIVGAGIVIVALFALAAMHALLIGGQLRLDDLRREHASESEQVRRLRLEVAQLEAPDRVLEVARDRLGMVDPGEVGYLLPVGVDGGDGEPVRVEPAKTPPPPPVVEPSSPEERAVDASLTGPPLSEEDKVANADAEATDSTGQSMSTAPSEGEPDGARE